MMNELRETLNKRLKTEGLESLQNQLKELDINSYNTITLENPHRLIRALEISISTGKPYSSFLNKEKPKRNFKTISIGLDTNREIIYERINKRVDKMMDKGLLDEVKNLESKYHLNALNTVGYKELYKYLNGDWTLDIAVSEIKKNTRRFAKRQLTWFKKDKSIIWFDYENSIRDIIKVIKKKII